MEITLDTASIEIQGNIETWREIWRERCDLIKELSEQTYGRHILLVLPDLIEEMEFNADNLLKNQYAKKYFANCLHGYFVEGRKQSHDDKKSIRHLWLKDAHSELALILEALTDNPSDNQLTLNHVLSLVRNLDDSLQAFESFVAMKEMLLALLMSGTSVQEGNEELTFMVDTLILLFWRKGRFIDSIERIPDVLLEKLEYIHRNNKFVPSFPTAPHRGSLSDDEHRRVLEDFYSTLSINARFDQLEEFYKREPKEYEVIFRVTGVDLRAKSITIGNVTFYDPRKEAHIKDDPSDPLAQMFGNVEDKNLAGLCISVRLRGTDSGSMKLEAKRYAERSVALLMTNNKRRKPIELQSPYAILDSDGHIIAAGSRDVSIDDLWTDDLRELTEKRQARFGSWMTSTGPPSTIRQWLTAIDWHRKSVEATEASAELLNAWFSVEHLVDQEYRIPVRVPHFLSQRKKKDKGGETWLPSPQIRLIQCVLAFDVVKDEIGHFVSNVAYRILFPFPMQSKSHKLSKEVIALFSDGDRSWRPYDFVNSIDRILDELQTAKATADIQNAANVKRMFGDPEYAMSTIQTEFWRIKDDVYNVYRLRNMLVHTARTDSLLLEYYAHRIREYSFSLLETLKWRLLLTKSDAEILSMEHYLRDIVLEGNLALEAVQRRDMNKFKHWIFST